MALTNHQSKVCGVPFRIAVLGGEDGFGVYTQSRQHMPLEKEQTVDPFRFQEYRGFLTK